MSKTDNKGLSIFWQVVLFILALVAIVAPGVVCIYTSDIRITTTPPRTVPAPAPTATPSPLFAVLAEQAKAQTGVTVVTAEADSGIGLGWYAIPVGLILTGLGVGYLGLRYGIRGQL